MSETDPKPFLSRWAKRKAASQSGQDEPEATDQLEENTAAVAEEAEEEALRMLQVYRDFCYETLAVPVVTGVKTANERFAGAEDTYTIEAIIQNG